MKDRKKYPPYWLKVFNGISTTNLRIYFTIVLAMGTAIFYWITKIAPDGQWLMFIGAIAGIDVAQFASKRYSYDAGAPSKPGDAAYEEVTATTDIQELSKLNDKG